jgi:hypothetical protein
MTQGSTSAAPLGDKRGMEPAIILDTSGSMNDEVVSHGGMLKSELLTNIFKLVVDGLAESDTAGKDEKGGGGVMSYTFSKGMAVDLEDVSPTNFAAKAQAMVFDGGTYIMPAVNMAMASFQEEFGAQPADIKPVLLLCIVTDGELQDLHRFTGWLTSVKGDVEVYTVPIGSGVEHDAAVRQWQQIAASNINVKVAPATGVQDAATIANNILAMAQ